MPASAAPGTQRIPAGAPQHWHPTVSTSSELTSLCSGHVQGCPVQASRQPCAFTSTAIFCFGLLVGSGCKLQGCLMLCSDCRWEAGRGLWAVCAAITDTALPPGSRSARDPLSPAPAPGGRRCPTSPRSPAAQVRSCVPTPMGRGEGIREGGNGQFWQYVLLMEQDAVCAEHPCGQSLMDAGAFRGLRGCGSIPCERSALAAAVVVLIAAKPNAAASSAP